MNLEVQPYIDLAIELAITYTPKLLLALATLIIGLYLIKYFGKFLNKGFQHQRLDRSLAGFLLSFIKILLKIILVITVASMIGVQMTSVIALLGAAGLAVGLALQGSLANFAGGVLILVFKPFKVGDYIDAQGESGFVEEIQIFHTIIKTLKNHTIIIPNGDLSNGIIDNYSKKKNVRIDIDGIGISYNDDIDKAKEVLLQVVTQNEKILESPAPEILVDSLGDNSVNFQCRVWVDPKDAFKTKYQIYEAAKKAFDKAGISIPFPQRDVHLYQTKK